MQEERVKSVLEQYPSYEATVGIEVHVQLKTQSKIFCRCYNRFGDMPNSNVCPICTGQPGVLPMLNKRVIDYAIMLGLATNCFIRRRCDFARKHYMYPDLPKNYQITQSDKPICSDGYIPITTIDGKEKQIRLVRIHIEEDAGKNIHSATGWSFVDLNRAGTPLVEIVSYPDIANAHEAKEYLNHLHTIIRYLGISDANMDEGSFRADVNVSVKQKEAKELGTKIEVKNINSFKFIAQAIDYEIERQIQDIEAGKKISLETRLWDSKKHQTVFMRSKEEAQDYRYFTEPDLPAIEIDDEWLERVNACIPELPHDKFNRFVSDYGLSPYEADILISDQGISRFFEDVVCGCNHAKQASNWILRDLLGYLKEHKVELHQTKLTAQGVAELIIALEKGTINSKVAQEIFVEMIETGTGASAIITSRGLEQISSVDELEKIVRSIIEKNPDIVEKYRSGNERMMAFFVGQAMKETKGKGNPQIIQDLLKKCL